jgi:hypothetical protein
MTYSPNNFYSSAAETATLAEETTSYANTTLNTIPKGYPVSIRNGQYELVNISNEDSVSAIVGVASLTLGPGIYGTFILNGTIKNIGNLGLASGKIFINHLGQLTNTKPDITNPDYSADDFVISIGTIIDVLDDPQALNRKDLIVQIEMIGQL